METVRIRNRSQSGVVIVLHDVERWNPDRLILWQQMEQKAGRKRGSPPSNRNGKIPEVSAGMVISNRIKKISRNVNYSTIILAPAEDLLVLIKDLRSEAKHLLGKRTTVPSYT